MSGGNCPETPRQKMIGMMYLFLTAMLALNVSGELLKAFVLVDESIQQSIDAVEKKNKSLYFNFKVDAGNNPRADAEYKKALEIQNLADELIGYIDSLKWIMVRKVDNSEEATPLNFTGQDNQDVAAQVMLVEKTGSRSIDLKDKFKTYKELLLKYVNEEDTTLRHNIEKMLSTPDPEGADGRSWQSEKFEHLPMSASMALMSEMISTVRNSEADMLRYLHTSVDASSFKFTKVDPYVIPTSKVVIRGGEYNAQVLVAGQDETLQPEFQIDGVSNIEVVDGVGNVKVPATSIGPKEIAGKVMIPGPDGMVERPFTLDYEVIEPMVVISPTKMNVFYEAVENPVTISVPGVNSNDLEIAITNAKYRKVKNQYLVRVNPRTAGAKSRITVFAKTENGKRSIGYMDFRIKRIPPPIAKVAGINEGTLRKGLLLAQTGIMAEMEDFDFELEYKVTRFNVSAVKKGYTIDEQSESNRFTKQQLELIGGLNRGDKVYINGISAKGPDNVPKKLGSITITID
ncbi:MAG: gliding motility protein GldM [Marinilabiliaceae bacterium]|nr:gliding motility protein GldM [Marinilabiliaceae bacterium]